ncbi:hypothetical protein L6452_13910 [Arctium lappa]|uniref:Uncharacterized protein n=1 Tax=Arctium lappa TaxID=4217 RepID=A0ACB9CJZ1_ARCLA|nr:hypothetical protein L6452_13910 [Arctium lappa]
MIRIFNLLNNSSVDKMAALQLTQEWDGSETSDDCHECIASAARAPAPSSAGEASPDLRSANSVRIDFIQERTDHPMDHGLNGHCLKGLH